MAYFYFCKKCEGDAGTRSDLCLECDSKAGIPRIGKKTLKQSRAAYLDYIQSQKEKAAHERRMNKKVPIDEAIEKALAPRKRRLAAQGKPGALSLQERKQIAELRRAKMRASKKDGKDHQHTETVRIPAPPAFPYGVSPEGAEHLVADWMRHLGAANVNVTNFRADSGVDVDSENYVAQVKLFSAGAVGRPEIQQLVGAALVSKKNALFFTSSSYTAEAKRFASQAEVALFKFVPEEGTLSGENPLGLQIRENGLTPH